MRKPFLLFPPCPVSILTTIWPPLRRVLPMPGWPIPFSACVWTGQTDSRSSYFQPSPTDCSTVSRSMGCLWRLPSGAATDDKGNAIKIEDENSGRLSDLAIRARYNPGVFLEMTDIFDPIAEDAVFGARFNRTLHLIWEQGSKRRSTTTCQAMHCDGQKPVSVPEFRFRIVAL